MKKKILLTASLMAVFDIASGAHQQNTPSQASQQQQQQLGQVMTQSSTNGQASQQTGNFSLVSPPQWLSVPSSANGQASQQSEGFSQFGAPQSRWQASYDSEFLMPPSIGWQNTPSQASQQQQQLEQVMPQSGANGQASQQSEGFSQFGASSSSGAGSSGYDGRTYPTSYGTKDGQFSPSSQPWGTSSSSSAGSSGYDGSEPSNLPSARKRQLTPPSVQIWSAPGTQEWRKEIGRINRGRLIFHIENDQYERAYEIVTGEDSYLLEVRPGSASIDGMGIAGPDPTDKNKIQFHTFSQMYDRGGFDNIAGLINSVRNIRRIAFEEDQQRDGRYRGRYRNIYWLMAALLNYAQRIINPSTPVMFGSDVFGPAPHGDQSRLSEVNRLLKYLCSCVSDDKLKQQ